MAEACAGWTDNADNHHVCQFADEPADHNFDGKEYCRFHLPLGKPGEGGKADMDDQQLAAITDAIIGRIKAESAAEMEKPEEQRGELDFQGVVVPRVFHLNNEKIWALNMRGAQFHEYAQFTEAQFHGDALFSEAQFHGGAGFSEVHFHGNALFSEAQFHKYAEFDVVRFHGDALFSEAQFHEGALFDAVRFYGDARFREAQFHGGAQFTEAGFGKYVEFSEAQFHGIALFSEVEFHGGALFDAVQFHGDAAFTEAQFHEHARFREAQFHKYADFFDAHFHGNAWFDGSADPGQRVARQFNNISFYAAHFGAEAIFSNRVFRDHTDFNDCKFAKAPNFHGSILHQDTAFGEIECFPDTTSDGADRAYRTLRQAMKANHARMEEGMFYTLEQKARRTLEQKARRDTLEQKASRYGMRDSGLAFLISHFDLAFLISLGYGFGSNYGLNIFRPFACLMGGIFASALLLMFVGVLGGSGGAGADLAAMWADLAAMFIDGLLFSLRQTFQPFDALRAKDEILAAYTFNHGGTTWLRFWGMVLTLFEALAALLLVLAVRWRYRR